MSYDTAVPPALKKIQEWFANIITQPLTDEQKIAAITPRGNAIKNEAREFIVPSPKLRAEQRIELYNQQYWWRLLKTMQETFPLVLRFFGYSDFDHIISVPYLMKYPSDTWSLYFLGDRLPQWIQDDYKAEDKALIKDAVNVDWAFCHTFLAPEYPPIMLSNLPVPGDISSLLDKKIVIQPHMQFFELPYDLFAFRIEFLKQEPQYWIENDFPELKHAPEGEKFYFVVYRNLHNNVVVESLLMAEYCALKQFSEGTTIDLLCTWLESCDLLIQQQAAENLQNWFQRWIANRYLALAK